MNQTISKFWIDESGDLGFKFNKGSSKFLIIVMVYLIHKGETHIENTINKFKLLFKSMLNLPADYEFKFSRCKDEFKKEFFEILKDLLLEYKAIFIDKSKINNLAIQPQQLYCELTRRLFYDNNPSLEKSILILDEAVVKIHHKEFNTVLRKYLSKNLVSKIRQKRSKNETMIQVADMIAGSIFRKFEKRDERYYQMIRKKEKILIEF